MVGVLLASAAAAKSAFFFFLQEANRTRVAAAPSLKPWESVWEKGLSELNVVLLCNKFFLLNQPRAHEASLTSPCRAPLLFVFLFIRQLFLAGFLLGLIILSVLEHQSRRDEPRRRLITVRGFSTKSSPSPTA